MQADVAADALVALLEQALPDVQVSPGEPGEDQQGLEAIWIGANDSTFEWRSLGTGPHNRSEDLEVLVVVHVYREAGTQQAAQAAARTRAYELERAIEENVVGGTSDLDGTTTFARVSRIKRRDRAAESGWARRSELTIAATHHPGT